MEDNVMERKFGNFTLDELKKTCEICLNASLLCSDGCPMNKTNNNCRMDMDKSVLELIDVYRDTRKMHQYWFTKAQELEAKDKENKEKITTLNLEKIVLEDKADKANKYDSVRNELIRTQELLKDSQDECRKRADKIKALRENIDAMDDDYNELSAKLNNEEMVRKSLEIDIKNLKDKLECEKNVIDQLMKEARETTEDLFDYHALKNALQVVGEAIRGDQSGNHEKD